MRLAFFLALSLGVVGGSVLIGMAGYHGFEHMSWLDAFANASMIASGMGPLAPLATVGGKLFAGFYALYSGLILIAAAGLILTPIFHRAFHTLHIDDAP